MNNDNNLNQMPTQPVQQQMPNPNMMNNMQQTPQAPMNQPQSMNNMPPQKKNNNLIIIIIAAVIVAILAVVIVVAVTSNSKDDNKKNDNNQNEEKKENEDKEDDKKEDKEESTELTGDWKTMKFSFDGHTYTLMSGFSEFSKNGWNLDKTYLEGDTLETNYKTYTTIPLINSKYSDSDVYIGLINKSGENKKYEDCDFWSISISNDWIDTPVDFSLPGGVKNGSTLAEIEAIYGKPEEDNIYYSETLNYYSYTYETDNIVLDLTIYADKGLTEFDYKYYG